MRDDPGQIEILTRADSRQMLVVSESWHPGWRARVDGQACDVHAAYGDFMGCVVEPGEHRVHFGFEPTSLARGAWMSAVGLLATLTLLALGLRGEPDPARAWSLW